MAERLDLFRRALAGAARAIAKDAEADVIFASDTAPPSGKTARVPSPGPGLEPGLVAEARGAADALALRIPAELDDRADETSVTGFDDTELATLAMPALFILAGVVVPKVTGLPDPPPVAAFTPVTPAPTPTPPSSRP